MLTHDQENDYKLPKGESCWITVGKFSVYITNHAGVSGQGIQVYRKGKEMENPVETIQLEQPK